MALDIATRTLLEQMAAAGGKPLHEYTPVEARGFGAQLSALAGPAPRMLRVEEHRIKAPDEEVPVRLLVPREPVRGLIVYYHGGGWVLGSIDESDTMAR